MSKSLTVAVLVGSLRKGSLSRRLAKALIALAPAALSLEIVEIGDLALYNPDLDDEGTAPEAWSRFRRSVATATGILFVTPEYNRSVPGALKNAIDVGSRPYGKSIWDGKPAAVISCTPGGMGGFGANHHLRQSLVFLNMPAMQQPEAYIGHVSDVVAEDSTIPNESTRKFLQNFVDSFHEWIEIFDASATPR